MARERRYKRPDIEEILGDAKREAEESLQGKQFFLIRSKETYNFIDMRLDNFRFVMAEPQPNNEEKIAVFYHAFIRLNKQRRRRIEHFLKETCGVTLEGNLPKNNTAKELLKCEEKFKEAIVNNSQGRNREEALDAFIAKVQECSEALPLLSQSFLTDQEKEKISNFLDTKLNIKCEKDGQGRYIIQDRKELKRAVLDHFGGNAFEIFLGEVEREIGREYPYKVYYPVLRITKNTKDCEDIGNALGKLKIKHAFPRANVIDISAVHRPYIREIGGEISDATEYEKVKCRIKPAATSPHPEQRRGGYADHEPKGCFRSVLQRLLCGSTGNDAGKGSSRGR